MVRKLGTWSKRAISRASEMWSKRAVPRASETWCVGLTACVLTGCYQHHTADEQLLGVPEGDVATGDAGMGGPVGGSDGGTRDGGPACSGTDIFALATCFLGGGADAGAGALNINDLINAAGGLGAITDLLGGLGGAGGRDAGAGALGGLPSAAQCQNATDALSQFLCSLQGGGGMNPFGRRDGGPRLPPPMSPADAGPPAEVQDAGVEVSADAGALEDAAADAGP